MAEQAKPLTQLQAAALVGVTRRRLQQISETDNIPASRDEHGRVNGYPCEAFGSWLRAKWARDIGATDDGEVYDEKIERGRLLHYQANNEALKEQVNLKHLIPAELVKEFTSSMIAAARTKILAIHSKVRGRFPELDKDIPDEVEALCREALQELGDDGLTAEFRDRLRG